MRDKSEYQKLLLDPRWQRKRLEILSRDEFRCRECGACDKTLHVHHMYYRKERAPWEYEDESLVTLCDDCHKEEHEARRQAESDFMQELRFSGVSASTIGFLSHSLSELRRAAPGDAESIFSALIDVVNLCAIRSQARVEFVEFSGRMKRHLKPFDAKLGGSAAGESEAEHG